MEIFFKVMKTDFFPNKNKTLRHTLHTTHTHTVVKKSYIKSDSKYTIRGSVIGKSLNFLKQLFNS